MLENNLRVIGGGLGILLLALHLLEDAIKHLVSGPIKRRIQRSTSSPVVGWLFGVLATPLLQSSSLVSLILLSFVGAGVITLFNAMGVILGMNVGITLIPLSISMFGFGSWSLTTIAFPLITIGGIGLALSTREHKKKIFQLCLGIGCMLLSIELIKNGVGHIKDAFDFEAYSHLSLLLYFILGLSLTSVIQSSMAVIVITLTAVHAGILDTDVAIAIVIGSNIGTTTTAMIGAIGGSRNKRAVALSHFGFNCLLALWGLLLLPYYHKLVFVKRGRSEDPEIGLALTNTGLNLITSLILLPLVKQYTALVEHLIPSHTNQQKLQSSQTSLQHTSPTFITPKLYALQHDCTVLFQDCAQYNMYLFLLNMDGTPLPFYNKEKHIQLYTTLHETANTMLYSVNSLSQGSLDREEEHAKELINRYIMLCIRSAKSVKSIHREWLNLESQQVDMLTTFLGQLREHAKGYYHQALLTLENAQDINIDDIQKDVMLQTRSLISNYHEQDIDITEIYTCSYGYIDSLKSMYQASIAYRQIVDTKF